MPELQVTNPLKHIAEIAELRLRLITERYAERLGQLYDKTSLEHLQFNREAEEGAREQVKKAIHTVATFNEHTAPEALSRAVDLLAAESAPEASVAHGPITRLSIPTAQRMRSEARLTQAAQTFHDLTREDTVIQRGLGALRETLDVYASRIAKRGAA